MTDVPEPTPPTIVELTAADFTADRKVWNTADMTLVTANSYASVAEVVDVKPGDLIEWIDVPTLANTSIVAASYDEDGSPVIVKGSTNRWSFSDIPNLKRTVLAGVYKIGFSWTRGTLANWTETSKIVITKYP